MTADQKRWLDSHRTHRAIGQVGGHIHYVQRGMLHADGQFEPFERGKRSRVTPGCFEVGVMENAVPDRSGMR